MMRLLIPVLLCPAIAATCQTAAAADLRVSQCFKVHRLLKSDEVHYWADWTNACPYTIQAVYITVGFLDGSRRELGKGVWPMYFVRPGAHKVNRFSAPISGFKLVSLHRITTDAMAAFAEAPSPAPALAPAARWTPDGLQIVPDTGIGRIIPYDFGPKQ